MPAGLAARLRPWLLPAGFLLGLSVFFFPIQNPDLWWHLSAGRWMARHWALPRVDFLSHTMSGAKWVDFEWGVQVFYHGLYSAFGALGLLALKLLLIGATVWTSVRLLALHGLGPASRGLGALLLCAALLPVADLRPDNFSLLFFSVLLLRLESHRLGREAPRRRTWVAAGLFFAVWANLHLAFLYGILLIAIYACAEGAQAVLPLVYGRGKSGSLRDCRRYLFLAAIACGATFLNPYAGDLYGVLREHQDALGLLTEIICEWQIPDVTAPSMRPYWVLLALSFGGLLAHFIKTRATPLHWVAALLYFGLSSSLYQRHMGYFCLVALPVFFCTASRLAVGREKLMSWGGCGLAALLVLHVVGAVRSLGVGPKDAILLDVNRNVADFLLKEAPVLAGRRLYNTWGEGGYLGYVLYPAYRVYYDGRYIFHNLLFETKAALRGAAAWRRQMDSRGIEVASMKRSAMHSSLEARPGRLGKKRVLLRPYYAAYMPAKDWALVYWNATDLLFVRRAIVDEKWLAGAEYRHFRPDDLAALLHEKMEGRVPLGQLREELERHIRQTGRTSQETEAVSRWLRH